MMGYLGLNLGEETKPRTTGSGSDVHEIVRPEKGDSLSGC
jgi:hypothetical protein